MHDVHDSIDTVTLDVQDSIHILIHVQDSIHIVIIMFENIWKEAQQSFMEISLHQDTVLDIMCYNVDTVLCKGMEVMTLDSPSVVV